LPKGNFVIIQSIWDIPKEDIEKICNWTLKKSLKIVLLPLTRCWEDEKSLKYFHEYANQLGHSHISIIDSSISDISKLEILSKCAIYVGESLHGFVSAASFGIRSGIVAKPQPDKFDEITKDNGIAEFKIGYWSEIVDLFEKLSQVNSSRFTKITRKHTQTLDCELDRICREVARGFPLRYQLSLFIRRILFIGKRYFSSVKFESISLRRRTRSINLK
jgi:polysaccharide pyruvyl transferase WcaK-like protein